MLGLATSSLGQTVIVQNGLGEKGFGWMFQHGSACYAAVPRHVAGPFPRVTITTAAPVAAGTGTVIAPFWDGIDLALVVVRGEASGHCTADLADLRTDATGRTATEAMLLRLLPNGEEERVPLRIENRNYLSFDAVVISGAEITQGTSGAFAFVGGKPIGMAFASSATDRATFMRSEEIHMHISRYLGEQGVAFTAPAAAGPTATSPAPPPPGAGIALELVGATMAPINPQFSPENLLDEGLFVFEPSRTMRITLRTAGSQLASLRRVQLLAPADGGHAMPKRILVQYSTEAQGHSFREWFRGEMARDGIFDTGAMPPRNMRRIQITLLDTWSDGPVALDRVIVD